MRADGAIVAWAASIDPFGISQRHRLVSSVMGRYEHGHLFSQAYFFFLRVCLASKDSKMSASVHLHLAKTMAET